MNIFRELGIREGKDRVNEEVIYNIARVYSLLGSYISKILSNYKLSPAKFNILLMVKHIGQDRGISQNEISKLLLVTTSNMTRMVDKLENEGYVKRISKKGDKRTNLVRITKVGSELLDAVWPHYKRNIDSLMELALSNSEKNKINRLLDEFKNAFEKLDKKQ